MQTRPAPKIGSDFEVLMQQIIGPNAIAGGKGLEDQSMMINQELLDSFDLNYLLATFRASAS